MTPTKLKKAYIADERPLPGDVVEIPWTRFFLYPSPTSLTLTEKSTGTKHCHGPNHATVIAVTGDLKWAMKGADPNRLFDLDWVYVLVHGQGLGWMLNRKLLRIT